MVHFPKLLRHVASAEGERVGHILSRLEVFHEMNKIRVGARFLFAIPFLVLGVDGLTVKELNRRMWVVDVLMLTSILAFCKRSLLFSQTRV